MKVSFLIAALLVCLLPLVVLAVMDPVLEQQPVFTVSTEENEQEQIRETEKVCVLSADGTAVMELEEYITCVVLAEMPAEFEVEALKAQAVVARTYTCRRMAEPKHEAADVCTESSCCQAFISVEDFLHRGGTEESVEKVRSAVYDTAREVLMYEEELIEATYFSCSGGKTEDAQAVWGTDVPYLQSVASPGEENAAHYTDSVTFSLTDFCNKLGVPSEQLKQYGIGAITYTDGGGVAEIEIGGVVFAGTTVRQRLDLRSTAFVMTWAGGSVMVTTKGFGHRVGMSQYGAEAMAVQGADYRSILTHYYLGTTLSPLS